MADEVAVFNEGRIVQVGTPAEIYERPRTRFVADFVGSSNVLPPAIAARFGGAAAWASLRPEALRLDRTAATGCRAGWSPPATSASGTRVAVDIGGHEIAAARPGRAAGAGARRAGRARLRPRGAAPDGGPDGGARRAAAPARPRGAALRPLLAPPAAAARAAARAAAPLARGGLPRLARALLAQSFFSIDEFSGVIDRSFTLKTYAELFRPANFDIIVRTVAMAARGHARLGRSSPSRSPTSPPATPAAAGRRAFYLGVMLPLWSSYLSRSTPGR